MGLLVWMVLVVLVSSVTHLSAVNVNWLTEVVKEIQTEYWIPGQFSLAANIPSNQDTKQILAQNSFCTAVYDTVKKNEVYKRNDIILAKPKGKYDHAELRVLRELQRLKANSKGKVLLIYTYLSPCDQCTGQNKDLKILNLISDNVKAWTDAAFVFTTVYSDMKDGSTISRRDLEASISKLGEAMGGLSKVFRCYGPYYSLKCLSCSDKDRKVSVFCVDNNASPGQAGTKFESQSSSQGSSKSSRYTG